MAVVHRSRLLDQPNGAGGVGGDGAAVDDPVALEDRVVDGFPEVGPECLDVGRRFTAVVGEVGLQCVLPERIGVVLGEAAQGHQRLADVFIGVEFRAARHLDPIGLLEKGEFRDAEVGRLFQVSIEFGRLGGQVEDGLGERVPGLFGGGLELGQLLLDRAQSGVLTPELQEFGGGSLEPVALRLKRGVVPDGRGPFLGCRVETIGQGAVVGLEGEGGLSPSTGFPGFVDAGADGGGEEGAEEWRQRA